jgi:hypothetical protein
MPLDDGTGTLGPGVLKVGETGSEIDISCMVNNARIAPDVSEGDSKTMLCGIVKRAADTMTWSISGSIDVDAGNESGLFALTWQRAGDIVPFTFTPSTALGTTVTGEVKLVPLDLGADNYGDYLDSDFEWSLENFDPKTAVTWAPSTVAAPATTRKTTTPDKTTTTTAA